MDKKSGGQTAGDLAHLAKALYDIIKAFLHGGWGTAAVQAVKHYWPQILAIAAMLIIIPIIVFCCLPLFLFGYASSTDTNIAAMTAQADNAAVNYDQYDTYINESVEQIKTTVMGSGEQNTESTGPNDGTEPEVVYEYEVVILGEKIQKNWFVALHAVTVGNDPSAATEADIRSFAGKCVSYTLTHIEADTETEADDKELAGVESDPPEPEIIKMLLEIRYLAPEEIMEVCAFSLADANWAKLIYSSQEQESQ